MQILSTYNARESGIVCVIDEFDELDDDRLRFGMDADETSERGASLEADGLRGGFLQGLEERALQLRQERLEQQADLKSWEKLRLRLIHKRLTLSSNKARVERMLILTGAG